MKKKSLLSILNENTWVKCFQGLDKYNNFVMPSPREDVSIKWCLLGAVNKIYGTKRDNKRSRFYKVVDKLAGIIVETPDYTKRVTSWANNQRIIASFNNSLSTNFQDIKDVIRKANV